MWLFFVKKLGTIRFENTPSKTVYFKLKLRVSLPFCWKRDLRIKICPSLALSTVSSIHCYWETKWFVLWVLKGYPISIIKELSLAHEYLQIAVTYCPQIYNIFENDCSCCTFPFLLKIETVIICLHVGRWDRRSMAHYEDMANLK